MSNDSNYDAIIVVSFGGPEGRDDVIPFLENVLRGKNVPRERMLEVAEHGQAVGPLGQPIGPIPVGHVVRQDQPHLSLP